jgi:glycosyltransferase involved in cell wall biosynthesis
MGDVTVVVPAHNEAERIRSASQEVTTQYPVLVVDDGSTDDTASAARSAGASVIRQPENRGYIAALKRGFQEKGSEIVVTFDADGEHRADDIATLVDPVAQDRLDLVLGARSEIPRPSERVLNGLARRRVSVRDSGTGFRAMRRSLAVDLDLDMACTCGTFVLEAAEESARIGEVSIRTRSIQKPRGIAWQHGKQLYHVLRYFIAA